MPSPAPDDLTATAERHRRAIRWVAGVLIALPLVGLGWHLSRSSSAPVPLGPTAGMVWIPGGEFRMGSTDRLARADEQPVHRVRVRGFWMDVTEVTNAQFRAFVQATGYRTVAERPIDWEELRKQVPEGTPKPPPARKWPRCSKPPSPPIARAISPRPATPSPRCSAFPPTGTRILSRAPPCARSRAA